jgi:hypothetical protein
LRYDPLPLKARIAMQSLTPAGQRLVEQLAQRFGLSRDSVFHMLLAVNQGGGTMAQFNCPELGGSGQWMRGGMTMVGDMFNHGLKAAVDNLCNELSNALAREQIFKPVAAESALAGGGGQAWWPGDLGRPFSTGSQNNVRYAVFPGRLAVESHGSVTVYDTLDHDIGGVSQQQGGDSSLTFNSQHGTVAVASLPVLHGGRAAAPHVNFAQAAPREPARAAPAGHVAPQGGAGSHPGTGGRSASGTDAIALIEQLARLRDAGVLTEDEFNSKKRELLDRL